jgi:hypothetical protein
MQATDDEIAIRHHRWRVTAATATETAALGDGVAGGHDNQGGRQEHAKAGRPPDGGTHVAEVYREPPPE